MKGTSIVASVLSAAFLTGAGALAATLGEPTRGNGDDPVMTLAIMAQLEKGGATVAGPITAAVEKVDDGKGNVDQITATSFGDPSDSDLTPPATPGTLPGVTIPTIPNP